MESKKMAVIEVSNEQYMVSEGETVNIDRYEANVGDKLKFDKVLLKTEAGKTVVGTPLIEKATVEGEVVEHFQGEKVRTFIYKAKSRYRKTTGGRAQLTAIKITKIN